MRARGVLIGLATALASVGGAGSAAASVVPRTAFAAGFTFVAPVVVVNQGDTLTFSNADIATHSLTSDAGPTTFDSGNTSPGTSSVVAGVANLAPGNYTFHCSFHFWMHGVLVVEPAGTVP